MRYSLAKHQVVSNNRYNTVWFMQTTREPLLKGRLGTAELLVLTSLDQQLLISKTLFTFFSKTSYLNEEVKRTKPSSSASPTRPCSCPTCPTWCLGMAPTKQALVLTSYTRTTGWSVPTTRKSPVGKDIIFLSSWLAMIRCWPISGYLNICGKAQSREYHVKFFHASLTFARTWKGRSLPFQRDIVN